MARKRTSPAVIAAAEAAAAKDAELAAALAARDSKPKRPPTPTLGDNFVTVAAMIGQARKDTRLSEQTLIKVWELTLMWALNNRNNQMPSSVFEDDLPTPSATESGDESEGEVGDELPIPNEVLGAEPSQENE